MYACIHYAGCAHTQIVWHMERSWGTKADPLATNRRATREGPMIMAVAGNRSSDTHYTYALFMMCAAAACITTAALLPSTRLNHAQEEFLSAT